jgi:hypothetical protein
MPHFFSVRITGDAWSKSVWAIFSNACMKTSRFNSRDFEGNIILFRIRQFLGPGYQFYPEFVSTWRLICAFRLVLEPAGQGGLSQGRGIQRRDGSNRSVVWERTTTALTLPVPIVQ